MSTLAGMLITAKSSSACDGADNDDLEKEAGNLILVFRLIVRHLLETVMKAKNRTLTANNQQLVDLFVMLEKVFRHGLKAKNSGVLGLWSGHDELWTMVEKYSKDDEVHRDSVTCIQQLPTVHKNVCRFRAWLRLIVMQKKLSDNLQSLIHRKKILEDFYEPWALLREETLAEVFAGSLIGLRVLECNLYLKEDDLNKQPNEVDLSAYVTIPSIPCDENGDAEADEDEESSTEKQLKLALDQCDYLEERNRFLTTRLDVVKNQLMLLKNMRNHNSESDQNSLSSDQGDAVPGGTDPKLLMQLDQMETAMASMEKDVHEKQDTIVLLRHQIDDVKRINLDLYQKLRSNEEASRGKDKLIEKLETERDDAVTRAAGLETKLTSTETAAKKNDSFLETLQLELRKKSEFCAQLQNELVDLQSQNESLRETRDAEMVLKDQLAARLSALKPMEIEYNKMKDDQASLERKVNEYEVTLREMGSHLEESKLKADDLKESVVSLADAQWESDKHTVDCRSCNKPFSVSRRKHHCRNCGLIFCAECSENTMMLPSSAKPVRVCDDCYALLLNRYSAKSSVTLNS